MGEYRLSVSAEQDLDEILEYTLIQYGEDKASAYVGGINKSLMTLANNPQLGRERSEFSPSVRQFSSGKHTIFYKEMGDHILVVRLLHQSMDIKRHL